MKKILLISGSLPPMRCGVGYYTHRLSSELKGKLDFSLLSTEGVDENNAGSLYLVPDWKVRSLRRIFTKIRESSADIAHIQYPAKGYRRDVGVNLLPYLLRLFIPKLKIVVTLHEYHESRLIGRIRDLITVIPSHKIIVSNIQDKMALPFWVRSKTDIIPIGSNLITSPRDPTVYEGIIKASKLDPLSPILIFFGFAYPNKKLEILLDALRLPGAENLQALLLTSLSRDNSYQRSLLNKVDAINKTGKRVVVTGFLTDDEVSAIMQEGRYFVLPQSDPISAKSSTAITAVTHGMVMITAGSDNSALTEPFKHLENSYLINNITAEKIVNAVTDLEGKVNQDKLANGAKKLSDYFSWESIVKRHMEMYEKL